MQYRIREVQIGDLGQVLSIYQDAGIDGRGTFALSDAEVIYNRINSYPNYRIYVAESNGRICGTFALLIMDNLANLGMPSGIVEDVAVPKEFQGKGIGKAMMHFAINECKRYGCYKMMLSSHKERADAHRFYESLGFSRHGFSFSVELDETKG